MTLCAADIDGLLDQYLGARWVLGGRTRLGIDCLGVVILVQECMGRPTIDPWRSIEEAWDSGSLEIAVATGGMPHGFHRVDVVGIPKNGAVALMSTRHDCRIDHVGVVWRTRIWSSRIGVGVHALPWHRHENYVVEVWDYEESCT